MRLSLLLITLHLLHRRAVSLRLLGLLALLASGPLRAQETAPSFRIGDIVWTSTSLLSFQTTTHAIFDTRHSTTIYTHGVGATNEVTTLNSSTLLDLSTLYLYGNRYQLVQGYAATNEWIWQDGALTEVWYCDTNFVRDTYIYNLAPLDMQSGWWSRATPRTPMPAYLPSDLSNGFKGPVGTVVTTDEHGRTTTDTYTTTAGLYVPGDPASTNEHFYRVQLSLEYDNRTPIPITFVTNYLGFAPDVNSNVYVWLREGQEYTAKPMFNGAPPSFYSYSAEATRGQQIGKLVLCTIAADTTWPGIRPMGIEARLNYPASESPSDDQVIQDILLNTTVATVLVPLLEGAYAPFLGGYSLDTSRGKMTDLTVEDRKWLTVLLLSRSTNFDPTNVFNYATLQTFLDDTRFTYRLANELAIEAAAFNGAYGHNVAGRNLLRRQVKLGQTTLQFQSPVKLRFTHFAFQDLDVNPDLGAYNLFYYWLSATLVHNAAGAYHDQLIGGQKGTTYMVSTCSGHAGTLLRTVESPILQQQAPDFFIKIFFRVSDSGSDYIYPEYMYSGQPATIWPTMFEYDYDFVEKEYRRSQRLPQSNTPFDGFLTIE